MINNIGIEWRILPPMTLPSQTISKTIFRSTTRRRRRTTRDEAGERPRYRLMERDVAITHQVYLHRALTTRHLDDLFSSGGLLPAGRKIDTRLQHRLSLLYRDGILFRDEQPTKPSEGRKPLVYFLDEA